MMSPGYRTGRTLDWWRSWSMLLLLLSSWSTVNAQPVAGTVDSISITVSDMDRAITFYGDVLGFQPVGDVVVAGADYERLFGVFGMRARIVRLRLGNEFIELLQFLAPRGRPIPVDSQSNDRWFQHVAIIVSDMDRSYARLRQFKVEHASPGPQRLPDWNPNAGGIEAFYFRDPDGNNLEILEFPAGKGDARWHEPSASLFLGIDHTAIVVADTDKSLTFYRDELGMGVAGESENYGPEQERLNNVFGARLRITGLRAASGPGVELLEYLAPRDGRPMPSDTRANDLWFWSINFCGDTENLHSRETFRALLPDGALGFSSAKSIRDPDGHAGLIIDYGGSRCPRI